MFRMTWFALAVSALLPMLTTPAVAQDRNTLREACAADYQRLCGSVQPGGGRARKCLAENADKLSDKCKAALQSRGH